MGGIQAQATNYGLSSTIAADASFQDFQGTDTYIYVTTIWETFTKRIASPPLTPRFSASLNFLKLETSAPSANLRIFGIHEKV